MRLFLSIPALLLLTFASLAAAQEPVTSDDAPPPSPVYETRFTFAAIDDLTFYGDLVPPLPALFTQLQKITLLQNQFLVEPSFTLHYLSRWSFSSSLVGVAQSFHGLSTADFSVPADIPSAANGLSSALSSYSGTHTKFLVKETYAGLSAGDFDFMAGRRVVRWSNGYAFNPAGVLDPARSPTNPTDRLSLNQGRDMVKADFVHGAHAIQAAWSTAALTNSQDNLHDTTAFRYNVLVRGFDTSLIAGHDRGGDSFSAMTFTRVLGQAWEVHGEGVWREQGAILVGGKYTTSSGITMIGEFYTPPNIPYFRSGALSPLAGRQHYGFFTAYKNRLRELPGWKQWDLSGALVTNLDDPSYTAVFDTTRRFGNHISSYLHLQAPFGSKTSEYGATPYTVSTSIGVRFQL